MRISAYFFLLFGLLCSLAQAQISPGALAQAHAHLEGMSNCTQCHDLGNQVSDKKCLACHTEIQTLIRQNRGYHADPVIKSQRCFDCHSDHHGRGFDMTRFDQDAFNHDQTGYRLEGAHDMIDCKACHVPEFIQSADIRKRPNTFLGLDRKCLSCHADFHQGTLSSDCASCHDLEAFRPAPKFDHQRADFPLRGAHLEVDCIECHEQTLRNGKEFQVFADVPFKDCRSCHTDPHEDRFVGACTQCHTEVAFDQFAGKGKFDHNTTLFELKGKHKSVDCFACHKENSDPLRVFGDRAGVAESNCVACHDDHHDGKYGSNCASCHQESSFLALKELSSFNHDVADFKLEGLHVEVDCKKCHPKRFSDPIPFATCTSCHKDYHLGEFRQNGVSPDCATCHSVEQGFEYSLYSIDDHQASAFPLQGAHMATPCFACHVDERKDRWTFRNLGNECVDCHQDIHAGLLPETYYPDKRCEACHTNDSWAAINFDHTKTSWPLEGKHAGVACRACHFEETPGQKPVQRFASLETRCESCHENVHGNDFAINGVTTCDRCHVTSSWIPEKFDHNTTRFPLEGRHAEVACQDCHLVEAEDGTTYILYRLEQFACVDCHQ